jgi:ABC-type transporter Mla subunit MlaD
MDIARSLDITLTAVSIVLALAALYGVWFLVRAVSRLLTTVEELRARVVPLLDKADVTLDALNVELLRIDGIVSQAEGVGEVVSNASDFIRSPVNSAAQGIARLLRAFGRR